MRENSIKCRAEVVDKMFEWAGCSADARTVFSAMSRFDRFYRKMDIGFCSFEQLKTTAFAAFLLIAEKQNSKMATTFLIQNKKFYIDRSTTIFDRKVIMKSFNENKNYTLMHDCISAFSMLMRKVDTEVSQETITEVDSLVRALAKSVLIDVELHQYC